MRVIIVGGVAGGASAAARLRRLDEQAEIILFERGHYISFANCGLPYYVGDTIKDRANLLVQTPEKMRSRFNIDVRVDSEVTKIDRHAKTVEVYTHGETYSEHYDKLILAPGASPIKLPIQGLDAENVFTLWSIPDADKVYRYLTTRDIKSAVVVGGGFVGIEMVENLVNRGIEVTLVEMLDQVMNNVDRDMAQWLHMELNEKGVHLSFSEALVRVEHNGGKANIVLASGKSISADMVILSVGIKPNTELAKAAGLSLGRKGHIIVDQMLTTNDPDIFALGDAVEVTNFITNQRCVAALAAPANKQGRIAAGNVLGSRIPYRGAQMTSVAKVFSKTIAATGLTEKALKADGKSLHKDYEVIVSHPNNFAGYYPGSSPLHLKVIYDTRTKKLLGAEACGEAGTEKRIDIVSTCMHFGGTIFDLMELELAYAPPYNTAKDPLNFTGFIAENMEYELVSLISWEEVTNHPAPVQIVDVREIDEVALGSYPNAIHIPLDSLRESMDQLRKDIPVYVFCRSGVRSYNAARILMQNGFKVKSIAGGWLSYESFTYVPKR